MRIIRLALVAVLGLAVLFAMYWFLLRRPIAVLRSALPAHPTEALQVSWYSGGGMVPEGENIFLSEKESYIKYYYNGEDHPINFTTTPAELAELYQVFYQNAFDVIGTHNEEIYDRGGISISLSVGQKTYNIADGGQEVMNDKDASDRFYAVSEAIGELVHKKVAALKRPFDVVLTENVGKNLYYLYLDRELFVDTQNGKKLIPENGKYVAHTGIIDAYGEHLLSLSEYDAANKENYGYTNGTYTFKSAGLKGISVDFVKGKLKVTQIR